MKATASALAIAVMLIACTLFFARGIVNREDLTAMANNVRVVDGTQIIEISARGGYVPRVTEAAANIPSVIRVTTKGTFDCSSSLTIPAIDYRAHLPIAGTTDILVPPQATGTKLEGSCNMGMYNFVITFK